jgi:hypothetical protein
VTQHKLDAMRRHHEFLASEIYRLQNEKREHDAKYSEAMREWRAQGYCDPPLTDKPF